MSLDLDYLSVFSEFTDDVYNPLSLVVVKEVVEDSKNGFFLLRGHSFSEFLDVVDISPSLEGITNIVVHVLEQLQEGFLLELVLFGIEEATVSGRLDGEAKRGQEVGYKFALIDEFGLLSQG